MLRPYLDFIELRGIGECVCRAVPQLARNFNSVPVGPGHEKSLMVPDLAAHRRNGIAESAVSLWVPCSGRGNQRRVGCEVMRPEGNQREQAEQCRGRAHNRQIGPLTLSFDAEMDMDLLNGNLQLPAGDEPPEDIDGGGVEISAKEGLRR